jgi:hypothetical protein
MQMDNRTQQNAALVEDAAHAAVSLQEQADTLLQSVSIFKLRSMQPARSEATPPAGMPRVSGKVSCIRDPKARALLGSEYVGQKWELC